MKFGSKIEENMNMIFLKILIPLKENWQHGGSCNVFSWHSNTGTRFSEGEFLMNLIKDQSLDYNGKLPSVGVSKNNLQSVGFIFVLIEGKPTL